jgi:hypothetical protein
MNLSIPPVMPRLAVPAPVQRAAGSPNDHNVEDLTGVPTTTEETIHDLTGVPSGGDDAIHDVLGGL